MIDKTLLDDLGARLEQAARQSPVQELEKNLRALLAAFFDRFDVVLREDHDVQRKLLERAESKLASLEARISELEARR
ncbi:MAG: accessory factor UbiK family protein [Burkholderiales bacterium]